jgi:hypothetical protein
MADVPWYHTGIPTSDSQHISRERSKDLWIGICKKVPDRTGQNLLRLLIQQPPCMKTLVQGERSIQGGEAHHLTSHNQIYYIT